MGEWLALLLIAVCLVLEGIFSGGEIALVSADIHRVQHQANRGSQRARTAVRLMQRPEWFIATTLTGTNLTIVASSTMATAIFIRHFGTTSGELLSALVMIPIIVIMIIFRSLFQQYAERAAVCLAPFLRFCSWLFFPFVYLLAKLSRVAVSISAAEEGPSPGSSYVTKGGLKRLLDEGTGQDILDAERKMVRHVIDFSEVTVEKIMIPISAVSALSADASKEVAATMFRESKYLRLPVYREQAINIVGMLQFFDLLSYRLEKKAAAGDGGVRDCVNPSVYYVPETKRAFELLVEMRGRGERMAVVVDEYGGAVGIVTLEDIIEEIVGEIPGEHETGKRHFRKLGPGRFLFQARMKLETFREIIPAQIPDGDYETLGGFLLQRIGHIPTRNETLRVGDYLFVIEDADARSIREVVVIGPGDVDKPPPT
jgi:CBS domain containing-hemolysin-like protein